MRASTGPLSSVTFSDWVALDYRERPFNAWLNAIIQPGSSLTYNIEYTTDMIDYDGLVVAQSISQTTTVITVNTYVAHNLNVGDCVRIVNTQTTMDGLYNITTVPTGTSFTVTSANSTTLTGGAYSAFIPSQVSILSLAQTANSSGQLTAPITAIRLNVTAYTSGNVTLKVLQGPSSA